MTSDSAPVPAFNGNRTAAHQTADNTERIASLLADLPRAIAGMLAAVVQSIPPRPLCAQCLVARIAWEASHRAELEAAITAGRAAHGLGEGAPLPPGFDPAPFLPEHLRPGQSAGMPPLTGAITTVNGTDVCSEHIPGRAAGKTLLVASGALNPSAMASLRA